MSGEIIDRSMGISPGDDYGHLVVIGHPFRIRDGRGRHRTMVVCETKDGETVIRRVDHLKYPHNRTERGMQVRREYDTKRLHYQAWREMIRRCYDKRRPKYRRYGARGIRVCDEWRQSYEAFRKWSIANGYKRGMQIDRIDNDGDYCPENCRYVDAKTNIRNSPTTKLTIIKAVGIHVLHSSGVSRFEIAMQFGVSESVVESVLERRTWADACDLWQELEHRLLSAEIMSTL